MDYLIRWMIRRDMQEVLQIESTSFEFPWSEGEFIRCLRQRHFIGMVVDRREDNSVLGFMVYELQKTRLHLLNFAVGSNHRRMGVGRTMVDKLYKTLAPGRRTRITLNCRESNLDAHLFWKSVGFQATSVLRDHYDNGEAAYVFHRRLSVARDDVRVVG